MARRQVWKLLCHLRAGNPSQLESSLVHMHSLRWSPSFRQLSGQIKVKSGFIDQAASCCDEMGQSPGLGAAPTLYASSGVWSPSDECGRRLL